MFDALNDYLDPVLRMSVDGVEVAVPFPSIRDGLRYKRWYADLADGRTTEVIDPVAELIPSPPDGLSDQELSRCAWSALTYFGAGPAAALRLYRDDPAEAEPEPEPSLLDDPWWGPYDPRPGALGPDDPGGGPVDPATGIRRWYNETAPSRALTATWADLLDRWDAVVCDFQQHYHLDLDALLDDRHIGWLEARIAGLQEITGSRVQTITALSKES